MNGATPEQIKAWHEKQRTGQTLTQQRIAKAIASGEMKPTATPQPTLGSTQDQPRLIRSSGSNLVRVGFVVPSLLLGGAETWVGSVAANLDKQRIAVSGVAQLHAGASHAGLTERIGKHATILSGADCVAYLAACSDVIVCFGAREFSSLLPSSYRGAVVLVAHGRNEWDEAFVRANASRALHFAAVSDFAADVFKDAGMDYHAVRVIHNGVDEDRCTPTRSRSDVRAQWGLKAGEIAVGYLGGTKRIKNSLAAARAVKSLGKKYRAVYVGPDYENLSGEIKKLCPNSVICGPDFQPGNVLQAFDCFLLASNTEGFSLALTEAWLMGVPTVATPVGAVPELESKYGQLTVRVPVGASGAQLAKAVKLALAKDNKSTIERAQQLAKQRFTATEMGYRWTDYLVSIAATGKLAQSITLNPRPSVSVIVTARNYGRFLSDCLKSCRQQTIEPIDIIYSDDFSTDDSLAVARSIPGVTVLESDRHYGVCIARNRGVEASKGDVLIHVDGDDTIPSDFIERHLAALTKDAPFAYGPFHTFGEYSQFHNVPDWSFDSHARLFTSNWVNTSAAIWRWAFNAAGGWQETSAKTAWDWFLAMRLASLGKPVRSDAILNYRLHAESFSQTQGEKAAGEKYPQLVALVRDDFKTWERKPSLSAICAVSKPDLAPLALRCWQLASPSYREIVLGCSPSLPDSTWELLRSIPRARFCDGTATREEAGKVRFGLLDRATGDWIANVDDDDLWMKVPNLADVPDDVGMICGSGVFFEFHRAPTDPAHVEFHESMPLDRPEHANKLRGSHWIVRRKAWEQISRNMDRAFWFSDWRLAYRIVEAGWKVMALPEPLGIVRRYSMDYPTGEEWTWDHHVQTLAKA